MNSETVGTLILCASSVLVLVLLVLSLRSYTTQVTAIPELRALAAGSAVVAEAADRKATAALEDIARIRRALEKRGRSGKPLPQLEVEIAPREVKAKPDAPEGDRFLPGTPIAPRYNQLQVDTPASRRRVVGMREDAAEEIQAEQNDAEEAA